MKINVLKIKKTIAGENILIFPVLVQVENRNYLVDCGYMETFDELKSELLFYGISTKDLTGVILTHDDYDHIGGLQFLKNENANLKVFCGYYEKDSIAGIVKSERLIQAENMLSYLPDEHKNWGLEFIHKLKSIKRFDVDATFIDGDLIENELTVVHTPGHTNGHISLFHTVSKTLITGDALVVENYELNIANPNYTLDLDKAIKSVEKIKSLNPKKLICYHGGIFENEISSQLNSIISRYKNQ